MEVLTQNNDFVMFLFSGVLQMAEKILFQKQIKRDSLPCRKNQFWWNQDAEGEELRGRTWRATYQSWQQHTRALWPQWLCTSHLLPRAQLPLYLKVWLDMRQSLFTACNAIQFFLLG